MSESLETLKASKLPRVAAAIAATAAPIARYLELLALLANEMAWYRVDQRVGPNLGAVAQALRVTPKMLVQKPELIPVYYPLPGTSLRPSDQMAKPLFVAYRSTNGAAATRHTFFASAETTALILAGCESATNVGATVADLPTPSGIAYLARDDGDSLFLLWHTEDEAVLTVQVATPARLAAFLAHDGAAREGRHGWIFGRSTYLPLPTVEATLSAPDSDEPPVPIEVEGGLTYTADNSESDAMRAIYQGWTQPQMLRLMLSFTHMLRQEKLIDTSTVSASGSASSRSRRGGPGSVTYLSYRPRTSSASRASSTRTYSHRWVVRGHWRRQWYPSQNRHHPIWITEYIAGPDNSPVKLSDKVTIIR
ncbi:MAG: hypothetical protein WA988_06125 [Candidatus Nanopelagicales bacterium]